jgi:aspartate 1-decarboxylase
MKRIMMHAKIHRATVTDANVDYAGSITLDPNLMDAAGILEFEQVHVLDVDNGARFETYVISGDPGSGDVVVNGAAAHLVSKGDRVIIITYAEVEEAEAALWRPKIVQLDGSNLNPKVLEAT